MEHHEGRLPLPELVKFITDSRRINQEIPTKSLPKIIRSPRLPNSISYATKIAFPRVMESKKRLG